jgi:hypothetical protein
MKHSSTTAVYSTLEYAISYSFLFRHKRLTVLIFLTLFPIVTNCTNFPSFSTYHKAQNHPSFPFNPEILSRPIPLIAANSVTIVNYFPPFVNISLLGPGNQHG